MAGVITDKEMWNFT